MSDRLSDAILATMRACADRGMYAPPANVARLVDEVTRLRAALDIKRAQVARVEVLAAQGGDYHWFVVDAPEGEYVQEGSPCVSVDAVRDALEGGERDPDSEAVDALLRQVAADAWDEGYRLDWTGGVKHINPYREDEGE